jgi:hypothetical protein
VKMGHGVFSGRDAPCRLVCPAKQNFRGGFAPILVDFNPFLSENRADFTTFRGFRESFWPALPGQVRGRSRNPVAFAEVVC